MVVGNAVRQRSALHHKAGLRPENLEIIRSRCSLLVHKESVSGSEWNEHIRRDELNQA